MPGSMAPRCWTIRIRSCRSGAEAFACSIGSRGADTGIASAAQAWADQCRAARGRMGRSTCDCWCSGQLRHPAGEGCHRLTVDTRRRTRECALCRPGLRGTGGSITGAHVDPEWQIDATGNTSQPGVIFRTPCRHGRPVRAVSGDHHRHQGVHTAPTRQGRRMRLAWQACRAVHLAANVDSANAITGDPLTSMHTATATSTAGQGPRATPLSTKLGGTAPAGSLPSSRAGV